MLTTFLKEVKDFRRPQGQRYSLHHTLLFSFMAICCNANTYRQVALFIQAHFTQLCQYFELDWSSAPHHTTIRNHIKGVDVQELEAAFRAFTQDLLPADAFEEPPYTHIAVDGKTLRGSEDAREDKRAQQSFSFFDVSRGLILGQIPIAEKTNEIPVFQQLLEDLQIPQCLFTADALHLQKKTFQIAARRGQCLLIQLKENQKALEEDVAQIIKLEQPSEVYEASVEQGHGRIEHRKASLYHHQQLSDHIMDEHWQKYIQTVVCMQRRRLIKNPHTQSWESSEETAVYLANDILGAQQANQYIRQHWEIENKNHYIRDVTLGEDAHKIRKKPFNFSILRSMALNFFHHNNLVNISQQRYAFSLNWTRLYDYPHII